ncbi:MAG: hypothetical protein RLZZ15_1781 [Verrucomicrobiota bacterium]|jgi:hypothetical protein
MIRRLRVAAVGAAPTSPSIEPRVRVKLFGGAGTLNVPSWSLDGRRLANVRYQPVVK